MTTRYAPYEVTRDLSSLGFRHVDVRTSLGSIRAYFSGAEVSTLFLHGVGMDSTSWSPLIDAAREIGDPTTDWLLVDIPGFGDSQRLIKAATLDEVGAAVDEVLGYLQVDRVRLVGHSMGGFLALHLAATRPELFSSIASISGAYSSIVDVVNHPLIAVGRTPSTAGTYLAMVATAHLGPLGGPAIALARRTGILRGALAGVAAHPALLPTSFLDALVIGHRPDSFLHAQATGVDYNYRSTWRSISVPILAMFGTCDRFVTKRDAAILKAVNPATQITFVGDAGHFAPVEQPIEVLRVLNQWWALL